MATGRFITSPKDRLDWADQYYTVPDETLRVNLIAMADQINEEARNAIVQFYTDPNLASAYRAWRNFNDLNEKGFTKKGNLREVVRIPAGPVYEFLCAYFEPRYGKKWLQNKKALCHQLVRPWWIVSHL